MVKWIGTLVLATIVLVVGPGRVESIAAATSAQSTVRASQASDPSIGPTDVSARRYVHHYYRSGYHPYRYGYRPYYPRYYARPYYYEPYPYHGPVPFAFGFGFGPRW
jgi:hypothetical protein